jgi:hypothetical protein
MFIFYEFRTFLYRQQARYLSKNTVITFHCYNQGCIYPAVHKLLLNNLRTKRNKFLTRGIFKMNEDQNLNSFTKSDKGYHIKFYQNGSHTMSIDI